MSFLAGGIANVVGQGNALASSMGLLKELETEPTRVQFLRRGVGVIFAFDATVNEQISRESQPSLYPIEDGGQISDHIFVSPPEITLTGLVSDTPIYDDDNRLRQVAGEAVQTLVPPLGVVLGAAAQRIYSVRQKAKSRSKEAFRTLTELQSGKPNVSPPQLPQPFTLMTHYARYPNMVIKSLSFSRDASTANTCVFTVTLTQLRRIKPQAVNVSIFKVPGLAAAKQELGEADEDADYAGAAARGDAAGFKSQQEKADYIKKAAATFGIGGS